VVDLLLTAPGQSQQPYILAQPRQALKQAQHESGWAWDPRLSQTGNRLAKRLSDILEGLGRIETWLRHQGRAGLTPYDRTLLTPHVELAVVVEVKERDPEAKQEPAWRGQTDRTGPVSEHPAAQIAIEGGRLTVSFRWTKRLSEARISLPGNLPFSFTCQVCGKDFFWRLPWIRGSPLKRRGNIHSSMTRLPVA
jgi:hypothetical protein